MTKVNSNETQSESEVLLAALAACNFGVASEHKTLCTLQSLSWLNGKEYGLKCPSAESTLLPALDCSGFTAHKEM